jgi:SAM domain (Sterile alpha motif)
MLPKLTVEDLISISVTSVGHRRKLLDATAGLGMDVPIARPRIFLRYANCSNKLLACRRSAVPKPSVRRP